MRLAAGLLGLALLPGPACDGGAPEPRGPRPDGPDVVLVVVDTLRADRLSQTGYERPTSRALDGLAERSTRFSRAFSPAPWTLPAVTSIFTGLLPARHRVDATGSALDERFEVLPELFARAGWHTAAFSFNPHVSRAAGFGQGFHHFRDVAGATADYPDLGQMVDEALRWLREDARRPFLLYLQPMNVHGPYRVPPERRAALLGRPPRAGFTFRGELMEGILRERRLELRDRVGPLIVESLNEQYDTAVHHTAEQLGRLLRALEDDGLFDDALVVFTADHGEELFDRGGFAHGYTLNREVLQVPLWIKLPGQRSGRRSDEPVSLVDLMPTLVDLLGLEGGPEGDGRSLRPVLEGGERSGPARPILAQTVSPERCDGRSLRENGFELMVIDRSYESEARRVHLYDVRDDPDQRRDLAPEQPERVLRMRARLEALYDGFGENAYPRSRYRMDPATRESLEALGYL